MTRPRQSITHVPLERLIAHPANIREDLGDLDDMAQSIREHGILQPLTATEHAESGHLLLLAGHRRLAAAQLAGLDVAPVVIRHDVTDPTEHLVLMLVENTQRLDINPIDRAETYDSLRISGLSIAEIARRTGTSYQTVHYYLNLLMLDDEERGEVRLGIRGVTKAMEQVRAERKAERVAADKRPVGRPPGKATKPYFGDTHPLAKAVRALCDHRGRPKVGTVGCGPCWEQAVRDDASPQIKTDIQEAL
ncbi:ParB/RepB/Spo0J family partition protein [Nocardioides jensenii]|uniref:ParB/RepB/Spo0J family partition protein n=1 Tax=Nocardioides jensenii TaxID=1843 RepID=UPI00083176B6|nr:ParB/RepB/Spo0J family partition protein [Nocardioides jensenii]